MYNIKYPLENFNLGTPYGEKRHYYDKERGHLGVDFIPLGGNIELKTVAPGKVIQVVKDVEEWFTYQNARKEGNNVETIPGGWYSNDNYGEGDNYGNNVIIDHGGYFSVYAHCSKIFVTVGENVVGGQTIAHAGNTGHSMGVHLHFEFRIGGNNKDYCVDPTPYFDLRDNKADPWAQEDQEWIVEERISNGCRPRDGITRQELWTMLYRFYKLLCKLFNK